MHNTSDLAHFHTSRRIARSMPWEDVTGEIVDISEYLDFGFYDLLCHTKRAPGLE